MYEIKYSKTYNKHIKKYQHNQIIHDSIQDLLVLLICGDPLELKYHDHSLKGNLEGYRCLHISYDLVLVYNRNIKDQVITLEAVGSHSELFKK